MEVRVQMNRGDMKRVLILAFNRTGPLHQLPNGQNAPIIPRGWLEPDARFADHEVVCLFQGGIFALMRAVELLGMGRENAILLASIYPLQESFEQLQTLPFNKQNAAIILWQLLNNFVAEGVQVSVDGMYEDEDDENTWAEDPPTLEEVAEGAAK